MRFDPGLPLLTRSIDGYPLNYLQAGAGTPLLLVHGSLCDCRYWTPQIAALSRQRQVIAASLRHYWPAVYEPALGEFSIARHADDLALLVDALQLDQVDLLGHSRGGRVVLEFALRHPDRVRSLVLADPGGRLADDAGAPRPAYLETASRDVAAGHLETGLAGFVDAVNGARTWERMVEGFKRMARDNASTLLGQACEPEVPIALEPLRRLTCPVLLIDGAASPARYGAMMDRLTRLLPRTRRMTVAGAAHGMNLAKPHTFNTAVLQFLTD